MRLPANLLMVLVALVWVAPATADMTVVMSRGYGNGAGGEFIESSKVRNANTGIDIQFGDGVSIRDNLLENIATQGIRVADSNSVAIENNMVQQTGNNGIFANTVTGAAWMLRSVSRPPRSRDSSIWMRITLACGATTGGESCPTR